MPRSPSVGTLMYGASLSPTAAIGRGQGPSAVQGVTGDALVPRMIADVASGTPMVMLSVKGA